MVKAFPKMKYVKPRRADIADVTLRDFSGGLQITENEQALKSKYSTKAVNVFGDSASAQDVRFGTKEFCDLSANVLNFIYFRQHLICVLADGEVQKVDDDGTVTTIWSETIANALTGSPSGWTSGASYVDFAEFRGDLIVVNGQDKPIIIDENITVDYLQDIPTGSNTNTPISRFVETVSNFLVMAHVTNDELSIYISATGASGTWPGDAAPNDAISFNVGAYSGQSSSEIKAISSFKNFLIVFFDNYSILIQLGEFDGTTHTPQVVETYSNLGIINHKMAIATDTDLLFASRTGVYSAVKNVFGGTLTTKPLSGNLGDIYPETTGLTEKDEQDCFIVNDPLARVVFLVFKKEDDTFQALSMKYREDFKKTAWGEIEGWSFTCGCTSEKGRVFFGQDDKIYQYGNSVFANEDYSADYITDISEGSNINFDWELPWLDAGSRTKAKELKKITFDTSGTSAFTLQCFVNNFYKDLDNEYTPVIDMDFVAGDSGGYGNNDGGYGDDAFGGGRRANDERFFGVPTRFKIIKMRIKGSTKKPLKIAAISIIYARGNYLP